MSRSLKRRVEKALSYIGNPITYANGSGTPPATILAMIDACAQQDYDAERQALVDELSRDSRAAAGFGAAHISDEVLAAIGKVPRHEFVSESERPFAYGNHPLPIGARQTISQPFVVALMTELAGVSAGDKVLEIGTGSGYQAAVLAEMGARVFTIEIIERLGSRAAEDLRRVGYENVSVRIGDGSGGWPEEAPFDAIVVTAAPREVPQALIDQLKVGGRMVVPVGARNSVQTLMLLTREEDGTLAEKGVIPVRFVPLTGES